MPMSISISIILNFETGISMYV